MEGQTNVEKMRRETGFEIGQFLGKENLLKPVSADLDAGNASICWRNPSNKDVVVLVPGIDDLTEDWQAIAFLGNKYGRITGSRGVVYTYLKGWLENGEL